MNLGDSGMGVLCGNVWNLGAAPACSNAIVSLCFLSMLLLEISELICVDSVLQSWDSMDWQVHTTISLCHISAPWLHSGYVSLSLLEASVRYDRIHVHCVQVCIFMILR